MFVSCPAIAPSELLRLDISPYNTFELGCTLISTASNNLMAIFSWTEELEMVPGDTILSISSGSQSPVGSIVTNTLAVMLKSVTPETSPTYTYQCMVGVVDETMVNVTATVTIRGMFACPCSFPSQNYGKFANTNMFLVLYWE